MGAQSLSSAMLLHIGQSSLRQVTKEFSRKTFLWSSYIFRSEVNFSLFLDLTAITDHSLGSVYEKVQDLWVSHFFPENFKAFDWTCLFIRFIYPTIPLPRFSVPSDHCILSQLALWSSPVDFVSE